MKRKIKLLLFTGLSLLVLIGWGKKNVELLNDKKLIDLNIAMEKCLPGADVSDPENSSNTEKPQNTVTPTITPQLTVTPNPRTIVIRVRNRNITYDSIEWEDVDKLADRIRQDNSTLITFRLEDDFAEAHVYRRIMAVLAELEAELGIRYTKD